MSALSSILWYTHSQSSCVPAVCSVFVMTHKHLIVWLELYLQQCVFRFHLSLTILLSHIARSSSSMPSGFMHFLCNGIIDRLPSPPPQTRMMTLLPTFSTTYRGPLDALRKIAREESPRVLFRGIGVVAGAAGPAHALYFSSYEFAKKLLSSDKRSNVLAQGVCVCPCACETLC